LNAKIRTAAECQQENASENVSGIHTGFMIQLWFWHLFVWIYYSTCIFF